MENDPQKIARRARRSSSRRLSVITALVAASLTLKPSVWLFGQDSAAAVSSTLLAIVAVIAVLRIAPHSVVSAPVKRLRALDLTKPAPAELVASANNAATALGISGNVEVLLLDVPVRNCGAFPAREGILVWATTGLIDKLDSGQLSAVIAAQLAIASDRALRRTAVNEALLKLAIPASFLILVSSFFLVVSSSSSQGDIAFLSIPISFIAVFRSFRAIFKAPFHAAQRSIAADAIAASTPAGTHLLSAIDALKELPRQRCRFALPALVDPFALMPTGTETRTRTRTSVGVGPIAVSRRSIATTTTTTRAVMRYRSEKLRATSENRKASVSFRQLMKRESAEILNDDSRWFPDPFNPDLPQFRRYAHGQWCSETKPETKVLQLWKTRPGWKTDPYHFKWGVKRWWDGERYTGVTNPAVIEPGTPPPPPNPTLDQ